MPTSWKPEYTGGNAPKQWLLTNGDVIDEPSLETSSSGRRVRLPGRQDTSTPSGDRNELLLQGVQEIARKRSTKVWFCLGKPGSTYLDNRLDDDQISEAKLHLADSANVDRDGNPTGKTEAFWRFQHPSLPIQAQLTIRLLQDTRHRVGKGYGTYYKVIVQLTYPATSMAGRYGEPWTVMNDPGAWARPAHLSEGSYYWDKLGEWLGRNAPDWFDLAKPGTTEFDTQRPAVKFFTEAVRQIHELETIQIPDLRDDDKPTWLNLDLIQTNVGSAFIGECIDYQDGAPAVDRVVELYADMREQFKFLGLALPELRDVDFQRALTGDTTALNIEMSPALAAEGHDGYHTVYVNLLSGVVTVACSKEQDLEEAAADWELAKFRAEATGEADVLLKYAQAHAKKSNDDRAKAIIKAHS